MVESTCDKCGYNWDYTGEMAKTTCPRCAKKTSTPLELENSIDSIESQFKSDKERQIEAQEDIAKALHRIADALESSD